VTRPAADVPVVRREQTGPRGSGAGAGFDLYPAVDLLGGRCVRLYQGDYDAVTAYGDDPVAQARGFVAEGADWVHVVDLDAARSGEPVNRPLIEAVAAAVDVPVQVGGGVRDDAAADALLGAGVRRVVVGTAALQDPGWVTRLARRHPGRIAVGLDARGHDLAVRGWQESSGLQLLDVARRFDDAGVAALVVTEIGRDGTLSGPALDQLAAVLEVTSLDVVASGGVGSLADVERLAGLEAGGRRLAGAIVGRALYEGAFRLADARAALDGPGAAAAGRDGADAVSGDADARGGGAG
jgi:phosphoribosylformimino-5-aminoimidazole carboxamide ribotide isomerase